MFCNIRRNFDIFANTNTGVPFGSLDYSSVLYAIKNRTIHKLPEIIDKRCIIIYKHTQAQKQTKRSSHFQVPTKIIVIHYKETVCCYTIYFVFCFIIHTVYLPLYWMSQLLICRICLLTWCTYKKKMFQIKVLSFFVKSKYNVFCFWFTSDLKGHIKVNLIFIYKSLYFV